MSSGNQGLVDRQEARRQGRGASALPDIHAQQVPNAGKRNPKSSNRCQCGTDWCNYDTNITGGFKLKKLTDESRADIHEYLSRLGCSEDKRDGLFELKSASSVGLIIAVPHFYPCDLKTGERTVVKDKANFFQVSHVFPRFRSQKEVLEDAQAPRTQVSSLPPVAGPTPRRAAAQAPNGFLSPPSFTSPGTGSSSATPSIAGASFAQSRVSSEARDAQAAQRADEQRTTAEWQEQRAESKAIIQALRDQVDEGNREKAILAGAKRLSYDIITEVYKGDVKLFTGPFAFVTLS